MRPDIFALHGRHDTLTKLKDRLNTYLTGFSKQIMVEKKFLSAWQSKKKIQITHPFLNEKTNLGLLPHIQSLLLVRFLRGDIDDYPPFMFK